MLHNNILGVNGSDDQKCFLGNESYGLDSEALVHPLDLESENYIDITSLPTDETHIESYIPRSHSLVGDGFGLVSNKVDCPIESMNYDTYANPSGHNVSLSLTSAPSSDP